MLLEITGQLHEFLKAPLIDFMCQILLILAKDDIFLINYLLTQQSLELLMAAYEKFSEPVLGFLGRLVNFELSSSNIERNDYFLRKLTKKFLQELKTNPYSAESNSDYWRAHRISYIITTCITNMNPGKREMNSIALQGTLLLPSMKLVYHQGLLTGLTDEKLL